MIAQSLNVTFTSLLLKQLLLLLRCHLLYLERLWRIGKILCDIILGGNWGH